MKIYRLAEKYPKMIYFQKKGENFVICIRKKNF